MLTLRVDADPVRCGCQVQQLRLSLQSCQSKEHDAESKLRQALSHVHHLQNQLQDAESRARTNESIAHRADTLARTLEGRLRELEAKVKAVWAWERTPGWRGGVV